MTKNHQGLNRVENILFTIMVIAILIDLALDKEQQVLLIISTSIMVASVFGIVVIEWIKLQMKQRF